METSILINLKRLSARLFGSEPKSVIQSNTIKSVPRQNTFKSIHPLVLASIVFFSIISGNHVMAATPEAIANEEITPQVIASSEVDQQDLTYSVHLTNNQALDISEGVKTDNRTADDPNQQFQWRPISQDTGYLVNPNTNQALTVINQIVKAEPFNPENQEQLLTLKNAKSVNTYYITPAKDTSRTFTVNNTSYNEKVVLSPIRNGDPAQQFYFGSTRTIPDLNKGAPFWPVPKAQITQGPGDGYSHADNAAWDFGTGGLNSPVLAIYAGQVIATGYDQWNGNYITMRNYDKKINKYIHLHKVYVKKGQIIPAGKKIALVGNTGSSAGEHLHVEFIQADGRNKDWTKARSMPWRRGEER
jgi:murein DD-endopeptidase MepM/ murein hydrolase activator NlpD